MAQRGEHVDHDQAGQYPGQDHVQVLPELEHGPVELGVDGGDSVSVG